MEHAKEMVWAFVTLTIVGGLLFCMNSCLAERRKVSLECLKMGKTVDECNRLKTE